MEPVPALSGGSDFTWHPDATSCSATWQATSWPGCSGSWWSTSDAEAPGVPAVRLPGAAHDRCDPGDLCGLLRSERHAVDLDDERLTASRGGRRGRRTAANARRALCQGSAARPCGGTDRPGQYCVDLGV